MNPFLNAPGSVRSLNQARVAALPGVVVDDGVLGKKGYDLLSAETLTDSIRNHADQLQLDPHQSDLLRAFDGCFDSAESIVQRQAHAIATAYGRRLGYFLLTLKRGDVANRAARPQWEAAHWAFWNDVKRVWIGGGLLAGRAGEIAVDAANALLAGNDCSDLIVRRSRHGAAIALVGLARSAPPSTRSMLVFDFGHTSVKRGVVDFDDAGYVQQLRRLSPHRSPCGSLDDPYWVRTGGPEQVWNQMLTTIVDTWRTVSPQPTAIGLSLACYLTDGHPQAQYPGCYYSLRFLGPHLRRFVTTTLYRELGWPVVVSIHHDGAAAAMAHTADPHTVVLTLGTAIGSGFPENKGVLRPVSPDYMMEEVTRPGRGEDRD